MQLYLITGFLGAGKTSFLKSFIKLFKDKRIYLIINEFGKTGVDGELLRATKAVVSEINNGSVFCACRLDKFEEVLAKAANDNPDIILIEASGLSDPTNIRKVLSAALYSRIEYMGSICLVDVNRFEKVVSTARVCPKQLAVSSLALLNKTDIASDAVIEKVESKIKEINPAAAMRRTTFGEFLPEWLSLIVPQRVTEETDLGADITLQKAQINILPTMTYAQLNSMLTMLAEDAYRIKGFVRLAEGEYLVNCVGPVVEITPYIGAEEEITGRIVLLAGKGMPLRKSIKQAAVWYADYIAETEL